MSSTERAGEILRDGVGEPLPLHGWIIAEEVIGRGLDPAKVQVVEPVTELGNPFANAFRR